MGKCIQASKNSFHFFLILFLIFWSVSDLYAQQKGADKVLTHNDSLVQNEIDVWDVWTDMWGIKNEPFSDTSKLKKDKLYLSLVPALGYTEHTSLLVGATANFSFYTDDPAKTNLSIITLNGAYTLNHQVTVPLESNIWTKGNDLDLIGDFRYFKYPSITYGLGGYTTLADEDPLDYSYIRAYEVVAKQVVPDFLAGIGYNLDYHYDIEDFGRENGIETDLRKYDGGVGSTVSSGLSLNLIYDTRRNNNNPQSGWFGNIIIRPNLTLLGSSNNWQLLYAEFRKYVRFPKKSHNILSFWNFYWFTVGHAPYLDLPATYWDTYENSGRGYVQDRFKGPGMMYFETEYRFRIMTNGLLGGVVFTNYQSFSSWPGQKFDNVLPSVGTGLRIKVNKHSNTNACIDYAWGINGSRGLFFNLGEVF